MLILGYSEVVNLIIDNTMTKSKRIKRQTIIYKTEHRKLTNKINEYPTKYGMS
jgi:hypothetical protein